MTINIFTGSHKMQYTMNKVNYKFIPSNVIKVSSLETNDIVLKNDIYEKYRATAEVEGELIVCNDVNLMRRPEKRIIRETYEEYLRYISTRDPKKDRWIYNIINGISEQDSILHKDKDCIVIPTYMWDGKNIDKLHLLCMPIDTSLRSIRSLTSAHILLLEHMKYVTLNIIKSRYNIGENYIKMFIHYEPSTYHLHIHFVNIAHYEAQSSVEYSHELNSVIFNLNICDNYYQQAILNKRV